MDRDLQNRFSEQYLALSGLSGGELRIKRVRKNWPAVVMCSDERLRDHRPAVRIPGSFMGMKKDEVKRIAGALGVPLALTTHDDCAKVAGIYRTEFDVAPGQPLNPEHVNEFARDCTATIAEWIDGVYEGHISALEMTGQPGFHPAIGLLYVAAPNAHDASLHLSDCSQVPCFVLSRDALLTSAQRAQHLATILGIAFGPQGYGDLFTPDAPFYVYPAVERESDSDAISKELVPILGRYQGRAAIPRWEHLLKA